MPYRTCQISRRVPGELPAQFTVSGRFRNSYFWSRIRNPEFAIRVRIPMKVVSDFDLIPVTGSEVKPIIFGAKRRWRPYRA